MTNISQVKNSAFALKPDSENETWLIFDIETDGLYDEVTLTHCVVIYDIKRGQTFTYGPDAIDRALAHLASADILIGHNVIFYDIPVLEKLYSFSILHGSLTHSSAHDSSGPQRSYMTSTQNNIRRFHLSCVDPLHLRPGDGDWPIIRSTSKTSPNFLRRCWRTASRTLKSLKTLATHREANPPGIIA